MTEEQQQTEEALFCIGCGAQIQTTDKEALAIPLILPLKKDWKRVSFIANAVSDCAIIMKSVISS